MKTCKKCNAEFSGTRCKICHNKYAAQYRAENKEKVALAHGKWVKENPNYFKEYHQENKEKRNKQIKDWAKNNRLKVKEKHDRYASKNRKILSERVSKWVKINPDKRKVHKQNRRARTLLVNGKLSADLFSKLFIMQQGKCACCHVDLKKVKPHMDHKIPLFLKGSNTDDNMQLLCQPCNNSKHSKDPIDFMQSRGYLL